MEEARPRRLSAALAPLLLAGAASAGGPASRTDAAVRFAIVGRLLGGTAPDRRAAAAPALDRAVEAALRMDWGTAIEASGEARARLLGRAPSAAERIAWGLRIAALPPVESPDRAAWRRVELRFLAAPEPPLPDFVEVRVRLEPFDAAPVPLTRFTCRDRDLAGRGDAVEIEVPETGERAWLVASVRIGESESDAPGAPLLFLPDAAARRRRLAEREPPPASDLAATLAAEIDALTVAERGEVPAEDFDPLASIQRAEALAAAIGSPADPLRGEKGEVRRACPAREGGGPVRFRLFVPTGAALSAPLPLLVVVPSAFETEAAPLRTWAGGSLRDVAEAKGVLVASLAPDAGPGDPIEAVLASVRRTQAVDPGRLHLLGRGSGAALVQRFALSRLGEVASVAILDGGLADEALLRPLAGLRVVAGGSGRGPTAPASRAIAEAAARLGVAGWSARVLEGEGWFESSSAFLREAVERAGAPRERPR